MYSANTNGMNTERLLRHNIFVGNKASIICVPLNKGQKKPGVLKGPETLLENGIENEIKSAGMNVENVVRLHFDDLSSDSNVKNCSKACSDIANAVEKESKAGRLCINIGGDHSMGTGTIAGLLRTYPDLCVLWVDAHADLNRIDQSPSGNVHGMPVSFIINDYREESKKNFPKEYDWCLNTRLEPSKLAYLGLRDIDENEIDTINHLSITSYDMFAVERLGIVECVTSAISSISHGFKRPIHVSFDIDSVDPDHIPCTGTPVSGGLTLREALCIAEVINETGRLVGLDIVELNPELEKVQGDKEKTVRNVLKIAGAFCGNVRARFT